MYNEQKNEVKTLLIIDDSKFAADNLYSEFEKYGFKVITTTNPDEVFSLCEIHSVDCILINYEMSKVNGTELTRKLKKERHTKCIPVMIIAAKTDKKLLLEGFEAGATDFVHKKIDPEVIVCKINAMIKTGEILKREVKLERYRILSATVVTLNHEINNPLQIAFNMLHTGYDTFNEDKFVKTQKALRRIHEVVKTIDHIADYEIQYEKYGGKIEMIKLKGNNKRVA